MAVAWRYSVKHTFIDEAWISDLGSEPTASRRRLSRGGGRASGGPVGTSSDLRGSHMGPTSCGHTTHEQFISALDCSMGGVACRLEGEGGLGRGLRGSGDIRPHTAFKLANINDANLNEVCCRERKGFGEDRSLPRLLQLSRWMARLSWYGRLGTGE